MSAPSHSARAFPLQVLVVDDSAAYRRSLAAVIAATDGFELAGEAADSAGVLSAIEHAEGDPDLVVMDVNLGAESGLEATRRLMKDHSGTRVVLVSTWELEDLPDEARTCGAVGFVPKRLLGPRTLSEVWAGTYDWR